MRSRDRFLPGILSLALFLGASPTRAEVTPRRLDGHKGEVLAVAFRPDGKVLASGGKDRTIILWDAATGKSIASWTAHASDVNWLAFSPDGRTLASSSGQTPRRGSPEIERRTARAAAPGSEVNDRWRCGSD